MCAIYASRGHKVTLPVRSWDKGDGLHEPADATNRASANIKRWVMRTYIHLIKVSLGDVSTSARPVKKQAVLTGLTLSR